MINLQIYNKITYQMMVNAKLENYDPTRTTTLRNNFSKAIDRRVKMAYKDVATEINRINLETLTPQELDAFLNWTKNIIRFRILGMSSDLDFIKDSWANPYILSAYKKGVIRARNELRKIGVRVPSIEVSGGINVVLMSPDHIKNIQYLNSVVFNDMKAVASAVESNIRRTLNELPFSKNKTKAIKDLIKATKKGTWKTMTRTNIVKVHHIANVQEYKTWGLKKGIVVGEFTTIGDDKVCSKCAELNGTLIDIEKATDIIPVHPNCRCFLKPVKIDL